MYICICIYVYVYVYMYMYVYIYIHIVMHIQFPSDSSPMLPCPVVPGRKEGLRQAGRPPATQAEGAGRNAGGHWVPRPHMLGPIQWVED